MGVKLPGVEVSARRSDGAGDVRVQYSGWARDLLRAGLLSAEMIEPTHRWHHTAEGFRMSIARSWRVRERLRPPERWLVLTIRVPAASVARLPGAAAALAEADLLDVEYERQKYDHDLEESRRNDPQRPSKGKSVTLKLVVNNTLRNR
jgi:hypothetical protein